MGTTMTARTVVAPLRWIGHGVDVRTYMQEGRDPLFFAQDVHAALAHTEEGPLHQGVVCHRDVTDGDLLVPLYEVDTIARICREDGSALAHELLAWIFDTVDVITAPPIVDEPARTLEPVEISPDTFSVGEAARVLARDPELRQYGQGTLFQTMRNALGWIGRDYGIWVPTAEAIAAGWLVRDQVKVRTERVLYPQVRVTVDGLHELHRRLGGIATLTLDDATPTLLDEL